MGLYTATYVVNIRALVPGATPQDIFGIVAATSRRIEIQRLEVTFTQTTAGTIDVQILKRSTPNTGGTFTNPTPIQLDTVDPPSQATIVAYTANAATPGTLVGAVWIDKIFGDVAGAQVDRLVLDMGQSNWNKGFVLQPGAQEMLCFNLNGIVTPAGALFDMNMIYTEV